MLEFVKLLKALKTAKIAKKSVTKNLASLECIVCKTTPRYMRFCQMQIRLIHKVAVIFMKL